MRFRDVDALFTNYMGEEGSVQLGEYLGIQPRGAESSDMGGASFEFFIHHAMLAIAARRCDVALIGYASRQRSRRNRPRAVSGDTGTIGAQFEAPYGIHFPIGHYALSAARYMHECGATPEHLARVAVAARKWASLNPKAWIREPLTVDEVLASPMICDPLHKLDCCSGHGWRRRRHRHRSRTSTRRPQEAYWHYRCRRVASPMACRPMSRSHGHSGCRLRPRSLRHGRHQTVRRARVRAYDNFTHAVLLYLEDLACKKGEAGEFVASGHLDPGGKLPSMTSGGSVVQSSRCVGYSAAHRSGATAGVAKQG